MGIKDVIILVTLILNPAVCASMTTSLQNVESRFDALVSKTQPKEKRYQAILVGIVTPFETKILSFGDSSQINDKTVFEIGSITKGFVGLALSQAVIDGKIKKEGIFSLDTAIVLPKIDNREIRWVDLANHTSGLPRLPNNMNPSDPLQPYLDYDKAMLESFLKSYKPSNTHQEYSNAGAGLVGLGLEKIYGQSLSKILQQVITEPLNMADTQIYLNNEQEGRVAPGYLNGRQVPYWKWNQMSVFQGAGALKSTITDMMKFLKAMMGVEDQKLRQVVEIATQKTWSKGNSSVGLFWNKLHRENIVWHNGGTYGSSSFLGYDPDRLVGIVVLSNTQIIDEEGIDPRLDLAAIETIIELRQSLGDDNKMKNRDR